MKMKTFPGIFLLLCFAALCGCATADTVRLRSNLVTKPPDCGLDVFADAAKVQRPYEDLCLIDARPGSTRFSDQSVNGAVNNAKKAACSCGADAIIISGYEAGTYNLSTAVQARVHVKAIRFTDTKQK
ncbi:MAG: hypothetical protein HY747_00690 [Elusimicrobia bacterium]|nr:hypothetical protein [Elusimicrobiota bacterium]